jgi:hypothetical protein
LALAQVLANIDGVSVERNRRKHEANIQGGEKPSTSSLTIFPEACHISQLVREYFI